MNRKKKLILIVILISCLLLLLAIKFFTDSSYRNQLPAYPDFSTLPEIQKDQIKAAGRKAYLNPSANSIGKLGMIYYSGAFNEKAGQCFQLAVKKNKNMWCWSYYLGYLNLEMGESKASIDNFSDVLKQVPEYYLAMFYEAEAYRSLGSVRDAERIFRKIATAGNRVLVKGDTLREKDFPLQTYAKFNLARIYLDSDLPDSAEMALKDLISDQITYGPAYRLLGNLYIKRGDVRLGNFYLTRANDLIEYTPPSDLLIDEIAILSRSETYLLKHIDDALHSLNFKWEKKLFDHSLHYLPNSKFLLSKALFGYLFLNHGDQALPFLEQHFKYYSDDFNELMLFAILLYDKGYKKQADIYFNQAKNVKPGNSKLVLWLAERGRADEAALLMNDQLRMNPDDVTIITDAVRLYSSMNNREKVTFYLTKIRKLLPSGPELKKLEGEVEENQDNLKEAIVLYEDALKDDPRNLFLIKHLVRLYTGSNNWNKLFLHIRMALDNNPNEPFLLEGLGRLLISCQDTTLRKIDEGREYSERAFFSFKSTPGIKMSAGRNLATAFAISGNKVMAARYIKLTTDLVRNTSQSKDYLSYFNNLRRQYKITE